MENVQQIYDQAFQCWQSDDKEKAKEYIEKALQLAPDDLAVHALAMHIYRPSNTEIFLKHAEFIVDHDIHYQDTLDKHRDPHDFLEWLIIYYGLMMHDVDISAVDPLNTEKRDHKKIAEKGYKYTKKILENGYTIVNLDNYLEFLEETDHHNEIIEIANFLIHKKTADEIGLPGLADGDLAEWIESDIHDYIMDAFFITGRDLDALEWCQDYLRQYPRDWFVYFFIGEIYCRLNKPEETARQWIIGLQKGGFTERFTDHIGDLGDLVADKECNEKTILYRRILKLEDKISDDRKPVYEKIKLDAFISIGDTDKKLISETYVEGMLQLKLPPITEDDYYYFGRLWLPKTQGPHPYLPPDPRIAKEKSEESTKQNAVIPKNVGLRPDTIERFGVDITEQVRKQKHPPVVGRDKEIDALIRILIRMEKNNPVLLGDAGVGKTAIILGLAQRINAENVPEYLKGKRIIELSMSALVGGTMWRGDFETRITNIIKELKDNKDIILFVDELHTIMGAGAANRGDLDVANIAKPALAKGEIRLVGATTNNEYTKYIEKDQAMARRFTPVRVSEMDREATLQVLNHRVNFWREHHHVNVPEKTLIHAIDLTEYHMKHRRFPDKAIDLLDESCAFIRTRKKTQDGQLLTLTTEHVNHVFREWTGTLTEQPEDLKPEIDSKDNRERESVSTELQKQLISQANAIEKLTTLTLHIRHAVKDPLLPFVLLLHGQPGTGKTTAANTLAQTLWPSEQDRVMVINMAEYSDQFSYHRLIGGPPGYAGFDEEGILTARIKRKPFSIIVLKNIKEAHPQILHFFSSLLRTGMFTDKRGQEVLAGDIIFILHVDTKAVGSKLGFISSSGISANDGDYQTSDLLKSFGFPSSWSKIYFQVLHFKELTKTDVRNILNIHLEKIKKLYDQKGISISFNEKTQKQIVDVFYDMPGEKRNMEMLIDQYIIPQLRDKMLKSKTKITKITIESR